MEVARLRKPVVGQSRHPFPRETVFLATPPERAVPEPYHVAAESADARAVRGNRVVDKVAPDDLRQPTSLLGYRLMHTLAQFLLDLLEFHLHAIASGFPFNQELTLARASADEKVSWPAEFHRQPLSELSGTLSRHSAPIRQTYRSCQVANAQRDSRFALPTFAESGPRESYGL